MKRILITVILTIICFGIGVTSFAVNDLSNLTTWYRVEVRPAIEKAYHDKKHEKTEDRKKINYLIKKVKGKKKI